MRHAVEGKGADISFFSLGVWRRSGCVFGLMASVISVVRLGLLMMRDFQRWVMLLHLCSWCHLHRRVKITTQCMMALLLWWEMSMLASGVPLGRVSSRVTVTTDASLQGWGVTLMGKTANGIWSQQMA